MNRPALHGTIILDACFLKWLERLDAHCRKKFSPPKTPEELPLGLLNRLAESGCHLIIPNEVMKEMFRVEEGRVGLEIAQDGRASLDMQLLNDCHYLPLLRRYITDQQAQGRLHCFDSVDAFNAAVASRELKGGLSIVSDLQRANSSSYEPLFRDQDPDRCKPGDLKNFSHGDDEILSLNKKLRQYPVYNFTHDVALAKTIQRDVGTHQYILFPSQYICLLGELNFVPNTHDFEKLIPELPVGEGYDPYHTTDRDRVQAVKAASHFGAMPSLRQPLPRVQQVQRENGPDSPRR